MNISQKTAWGAWFIASLFYAYQYILKVMPNTMINEIMTQFNIDAVIFGQFSGAYYIGYAITHIPMGIAIDKYGPKKVMSTCILLTTAGLTPIIFSDNWIYPIIGRFLIGVGSGASILATFKIIRIGFEDKNFAKMLSFCVTIGLLGAIYGGEPVSQLCQNYGHISVMKCIAIIGVFLAAITYILVPETKGNNSITAMSGIKTIISNKKVMLICFFAGLMVGPLEGFANSWGSEFLKQTYKFDSSTTKQLTSIIFLGMCCAPILSKIGEKTGNYIGTIAGSGLIMMIIFAMIVVEIMNIKSISFGLFIVGICCAYKILVIYKASTYVNENVTGLATSITNMIMIFFGYIFNSSIGLIIKCFSNEGKEIAYTYGISVIPITLFIGAFGFIIIEMKEKSNINQTN